VIPHRLFGEDGDTGRPLQFPMLELEFAQLSDTGRVREGNEDYLGHVAPATPEAARSLGWLFVLADGVGGHDKGEVASRTAVEFVLAGFRKANLMRDFYRD
jgi:PPM family protein phosphatase